MTRFAVSMSRLALAALSVLALPAQALTTNLLGNAGFESSPVTGINSYCYVSTGGQPVPACTSALSGWTTSGLVAAIGANSADWGTPSALGGSTGLGLGTEVLGLQGDSATLAQAVTGGSAAAYKYTLSWYDAGRGGYNANDLVYDLYFDSTKLGSYAISAGTAWSQHTVSFTAAGSGELRLVVNAGVYAGADRTVFVDNLALSAVAAPVTGVPEPTTLALAGLAAAGVLVVRRRRR